VAGSPSRLSRGLNECDDSAFLVVTTLDEYHGADYVEGYAIVGNGAPLEHGWIERDSEIIDPTFTTVDTIYFGGLRCHGAEELIRKLKELPKQLKDDLPLFYRFGWRAG